MESQHETSAIHGIRLYNEKGRRARIVTVGRIEDMLVSSIHLNFQSKTKIYVFMKYGYYFKGIFFFILLTSSEVLIFLSIFEKY